MGELPQRDALTFLHGSQFKMKRIIGSSTVVRDNPTTHSVSTRGTSVPIAIPTSENSSFVSVSQNSNSPPFRIHLVNTSIPSHDFPSVSLSTRGSHVPSFGFSFRCGNIYGPRFKTHSSIPIGCKKIPNVGFPFGGNFHLNVIHQTSTSHVTVRKNAPRGSRMSQTCHTM
jgi:hypothetical protein